MFKQKDRAFAANYPRRCAAQRSLGLRAAWASSGRVTLARESYEPGTLPVAQPLPWHGTDHPGDPDVTRRVAKGDRLEFGHRLDGLIGGQIKAGFSIPGFFEDGFDPESEIALGRFSHWMIATRAIKLV